MRKKIFSSVLLCTLTLAAITAPVTTLADSFDQKLEEKNQEILDLQNKQASTQQQLAALEGEVSLINETAQELLAEQTEISKQTAELQQEIKSLEVRIEKREEAIRNQARDVQVNGQDASILSAVLNANSLSDAISRVQAVTTMVNANNDLVVQQKEDKQVVESKKLENDQKFAQLNENQAILEQKKGDLEKSQADLAVVKADLALQQATKESEKEEINQQKASAEAEQARILEENRLIEKAAREREAQAEQEANTPTAANETETENVSDVNAQEQVTEDSTDLDTVTAESEEPAATVPSDTENTEEVVNDTPSVTPPVSEETGNAANEADQSTPAETTPTPAPVETTPTEVETPATPTPPASSNGSAIVAEAYRHIGKAYVWGAKGPDSFDCSGFTRYVYLQVTGRDIGGWTVPQESAGTQISVSQAQPGDLLFWGSRGGTYHVAIATGNGGYVHAANPAQGVLAGSVSSWAPDFAVRM